MISENELSLRLITYFTTYLCIVARSTSALYFPASFPPIYFCDISIWEFNSTWIKDIVLKWNQEAFRNWITDMQVSYLDLVFVIANSGLKAE